MGKKKQQSRILKNKKSTAENKQIMKEVLTQLAKNKVENKQIMPKLHPIAHINHINHSKKIQKKRTKRENKKEKDGNEGQEDEREEVVKPQINIFAVDNYVSEKPVEVKMVDESEQKQLDLESRARKVMGRNLNIDKFGDKPMKIINQENEVVALSQDEDQPNSKKSITHENIRIPQGYCKYKRNKQIKELREKLPIFMKEQEVVETVNTHLVSLVCGETGSGKSTQLPQFLAQKNYQSFGKIGITQPRRLATTALARRVCEQMSLQLGKQIGYQVRHDNRQSKETYIKFMTDGILLKQMNTDSLLNDYGIIIIDEAHERKLNTDILIGLLSKLVLIRYKMSLQNKCRPLRLVIMSATMRVSDFQNQKLFDFPLPILKVESRMFPVTVFHQKKTPDSYLEEAVKKCVRIHKKLPQGDVLIFLTGKDQINEMAIKLQQTLQRNEFEELQLDQNEDMERDGEQINEQITKSQTKFLIYKLYSSLPSSQQQRVFHTAPPGTRKFIISTNIAQTSITVPNIRYVIDSGQEKHKYFDGVWKWKKGWGSKAMAEQRAGRAGRTAHGYCYRLFSSALYANKMQKHPDPQICKLPLDSILLQIKTIGFQNVYSFPFPTPPQKSSIYKALEGLSDIKAIEGTFNQQNDWSSATQLGKVISFIPIEPKLGKMLLLGSQQKIEKHTLLCVILLTVQSIFSENFLNEQDVQEENRSKKQYLLGIKKKKHENFVERYKSFIPANSNKADIFVSINIVGQFFKRVFKNKGSKVIEYCLREQSEKLNLNSNVMRQLYYNCDQISEIYETLTQKKIVLEQNQPLTQEVMGELLNLLLLTFSKNVCRFEQKNKYKQKDQKEVFIHNFSSLYKQKKLFVGYVDMFLAQNGRNYMNYPFAIQNYELLASFGKIPEPRQYIWKDNKIVGQSSAIVYGWQIPNVYVYESHSQLKYYYFARFLLEGTIVSALKVLKTKNMLTSPTSGIRPDNLDEKVQKLVLVLRQNEMDSKQKLVLKLKEDRHFLERELKLWIKANNFNGVYESLRKYILSEK